MATGPQLEMITFLPAGGVNPKHDTDCRPFSYSPKLLRGQLLTWVALAALLLPLKCLSGNPSLLQVARTQHLPSSEYSGLVVVKVLIQVCGHLIYGYLDAGCTISKSQPRDRAILF